MKVQVLGTGCPKCNRLYAEAEKAAAEIGGNVELEKVEDINDILAFGVMMTPALAIDGAVKSSGKVPKVNDIVSWLKEAQ